MCSQCVDRDFKKGLAIDPDNAAIDNDYGYMLAERGLRSPSLPCRIPKRAFGGEGTRRRQPAS